MVEIITTPLNNAHIESLAKMGVNAVMLSDTFNGARDAAPRSKEELEAAIKMAQDVRLKVYVKMNHIYMEKELDEALVYLTQLQALNIDGIYYNDQAVYELAKQLNMEKLLIYDPDTLMTNSRDINLYLEQGIQSVVLGKEITKEEAIQIAGNTKNVQMVVHGYLPMSYSKRMLIDNYLEEIDSKLDLKNNRHLTLVESTRTGHMPILEDNQGTAIFTDYIQESFNEVKELVDAGVKGIIIDPIFQKQEDIDEAIQGYVSILNGKDSKTVQGEYKTKHPELTLSTGYLYQKTNLVK